MDKKTNIYVGPTIEGIVQTGTAFRGGLPPRLAELVSQEPFLSDLMVPATKLAEARKELRNPESSLRALYRKAERGGKQDV